MYVTNLPEYFCSVTSFHCSPSIIIPVLSLLPTHLITHDLAFPFIQLHSISLTFVDQTFQHIFQLMLIPASMFIFMEISSTAAVNITSYDASP